MLRKHQQALDLAELIFTPEPVMVYVNTDKPKVAIKTYTLVSS